mgnify:CR=1 FL=1
MPEVDDFDIVRDEDEVSRPRSTWLWIGLVGLVALFAFGVGAAWMMLNSRLGDAPQTLPGAATPNPLVALASATPIFTDTAVITATVQATATGTVTPTPSPSPMPTPTPGVACGIPVADLFVALYDELQYGCPTDPGAIVWAAWQPFQFGRLLWRSDTDRAYAFLPGDQWFPIVDRWDGSPAANRGAPPPGLLTPERGFGYVWSRNDELFQALGWATDREKGFCALVQTFERGFMLYSLNIPSCTPENLYNHATAGDWSPLLILAPESARRAGSILPVPPQTNTGQDPAQIGQTTLTRPPAHGLVLASQLGNITLDAQFDDWPTAWQPLTAIVQGLVHHTGPTDLSADFQAAWNERGLLLAVRVQDDIYRPGPGGTNLWRGDGIEVHFDRRLADDFTRSVADSDDYQIGIAFDPALRAIRAYRWLPFAREGNLNLSGAVRSVGGSYHVEVIIPWQVFELDPTTELPRTGTTNAYLFGFNISINDNDGPRPDQETVLSFSPARTSHDNPTEWATLRLLP